MQNIMQEKRLCFHQNPQDVVRIFPFSVRSEEDPLSSNGRYSFSEVVLAEKTENAKNPHQLMPIGGKVDAGESPDIAVIRETLEETAGRVHKLSLIPQKQNYSFGEGDYSRHAIFYTAEIPGGTADLYPLNPEEDKLSFQRLTLDQLQQLFSEGEHENKPLLDSFILNPSIRQSCGTEADTDEIISIQKQVLASMRDYESRLKQKILFLLLRNIPPKERWSSEDRTFKGVFNEIKNTSCDDMENYFSQFLERYNVTDDEIKRAHHLLCLQKKMEPRNGGESIYEAMVRLIEVFPEEMERDEIMTLLRANPNVRLVMKALRNFSKGVRGGKPKRRKKQLLRSSSSKRERGNSSQEGDESNLQKESFVDALMKTVAAFSSPQVQKRRRRMGKVFQNSIRILHSLSQRKGQTNLGTLSTYANRMMSDITGDHLSQKIGKGYKLSLIDSLNEISTESSPARLLEMAQGKNLPSSYEEDYNTDIRSRFVFEARRKLVLMAFASETHKVLNARREKGVEKISRLFDKLMGAPSQVDITTTTNVKGKLLAIKTPSSSVEEGNDRIAQYVKKFWSSIKSENVNTSQDFSRNSLHHRGMSYFSNASTREKTVSSIMRKILTRGESPHAFDDIFGRTIAIDTSNKSYMRREEQEIEVFDKKSSKSSKKKFKDYKSVLLFLENIKREEPRARILRYVPSSPVGESCKSEGGGGGAKICFSKIYLEIDGEIEEIMIFPTTKDNEGNVQQGYYHQLKKKEDDKKYAISRLLTPGKGISKSLVEFLWPASIYGVPIHSIQSREM